MRVSWEHPMKCFAAQNEGSGQSQLQVLLNFQFYLLSESFHYVLFPVGKVWVFRVGWSSENFYTSILSIDNCNSHWFSCNPNRFFYFDQETCNGCARLWADCFPRLRQAFYCEIEKYDSEMHHGFRSYFSMLFGKNFPEIMYRSISSVLRGKTVGNVILE